MSFLTTIPEDTADGGAAEIYQSVRAGVGYVPGYTKAFSLRPEAWKAWRHLVATVSGSMDKRRYELVTLAAAVQFRSSACALGHGKILRDDFFDADDLQHVVQDPNGASLDDLDRSIYALGWKIAEDAGSVSQADVYRLRGLGLDDGEILDVILAAAARSFFTKVLDATGTLPDRGYDDLEPELREALTVGRPIVGASDNPQDQLLF